MKKTRLISYSAIIAAMYIILTFVSSIFGLSSGAIQIRLGEALTILPYFTPYAIYGLFAGCIISNIVTGCMLWDIVFGSLATLIGAVITYLCSKIKSPKAKWLTPIGPIVSNTVIIPIVLSKVYGLDDAMWFLCLTVGIGEILSCGVLGMLFFHSMQKHKNKLF